jgi:hypothetical protein
MKLPISLSKAFFPYEQLFGVYRIASSLPGGHAAQDIIYLPAAFLEKDTGAKTSAVPDITEHGHWFIFGNIRYPFFNMPYIDMPGSLYVARIPFIISPIIQYGQLFPVV